MPLDGHSYLVSQGWGGKGKGLRDGAISRPIAVAQKKNLAGLGKDRDEAFPFWDHLFSAAASAIKVHVDDSDDEESDSGKSDEATEGKSKSLAFKRTETGIISNRRPVQGISAHGDSSGTSTPSSSSPDPSSSSGVKYSLMTIAKRDAAKQGLYSRFFRGPTLGPDASFEKQVRESSPKPRYVAGDGEETTVKAMMVRQLENAKVEGKETRQKKVKNGEEENGEDKVKRRKYKEQKAERKRAKEEKKKEKEEKSVRKEKRAAKEKNKGVETATITQENKEKRKPKGKEKALEESESTAVSTLEKGKKSSSLKIRKCSEKKGRKGVGSESDTETTKMSKRVRDGEDEGDKPKRKKKRKSDDSH